MVPEIIKRHYAVKLRSKPEPYLDIFKNKSLIERKAYFEMFPNH
ncbi:hypothetical protein [Methanosarcina siciliae]|nr:hypothetical protein [Methanosarcina siciliae]